LKQIFVQEKTILNLIRLLVQLIILAPTYWLVFLRKIELIWDFHFTMRNRIDVSLK